MTAKSCDTQFVELLYKIGEFVHSSEDPNQVLNWILPEIVEYFSVQSASISLFNPNHNRLDIEAFYGLPENCCEWSLPMGVGLTGWVALHHKSLIVDDVTLDPRYVKMKDSVRSALAVPLMDDSSSLGVLGIEADHIGAFNKDDQMQLELIASLTVRVVSRIWRITNLKKKCSQFESIVTIVGKLSNRFELGGILSDLTQEARVILDCQMCSLYLVKDPGELSLQVLIGPDGLMKHHELLKFEDSTMGAAVLHGKTVEVGNLPETEENHFSELIRKFGLKGMLSTPLIYEKQVIGVLNAYTTTPHRFSDTEKQIFQALANIGAFSIENSKLYNRIIDSEDVLRSSERLTTLGLLAAEIAHEIRNPLTVIKLLVESFSLDLELDVEKQKDLHVVLEEIENLGEIVGRVLNFGKNQNQLFSRWDINLIVMDSIQLVRFKLRRSRVSIQFDPGPPVYVNCHKGQIQQVILNLFINADEAMPGGGSISIRIVVDEAKSYMNLYFSDTGQGIPENVRENIFASFLSGKPSGSGLGLSIVKRILRDHRGNIAIENTSSEGTCFKVWLPLLVE